MRLLNTGTLEFQEFFDSNIPEYAILSHCWGDDEVSYEKFLATPEDARVGTGWEKILKLCEIAGTIGLECEHCKSDVDVELGFEEEGVKLHKFDWVWIDTCCIDKRSSAELSEAINSMYKWYGDAAVCLVFLPDVHIVLEQDAENIPDLQRNELYAPYSRNQLRESRWFSRGWTLQELVAPWRVAFYNTSYQILGWKHDRTMVTLISEITLIKEEFLRAPPLIKRTAIAVRLSWAASRETSRKEDMSYCLLGLCEVNLPLLYGEGGQRAFRRLQLEIISQSTDDSIFAWWRPWSPCSREINTFDSLIAESPADFQSCRDDDGRGSSLIAGPAVVYTKTQRGIEFDLKMPRGLRPLRGGHFVCACLRYEPSRGTSVYLLLRVIGSGSDLELYREGLFVIDRMRLSDTDVWKDVLARKDWRYSEALISDLRPGRNWEQARAVYLLRPLSLRHRLQKLWYKLYPAKTIHVYVPVDTWL